MNLFTSNLIKKENYSLSVFLIMLTSFSLFTSYAAFGKNLSISNQSDTPNVVAVDRIETGDFSRVSFSYTKSSQGQSVSIHLIAKPTTPKRVYVFPSSQNSQIIGNLVFTPDNWEKAQTLKLPPDIPLNQLSYKIQDYFIISTNSMGLGNQEIYSFLPPNIADDLPHLSTSGFENFEVGDAQEETLTIDITPLEPKTGIPDAPITVLPLPKPVPPPPLPPINACTMRWSLWSSHEWRWSTKWYNPFKINVSGSSRSWVVDDCGNPVIVEEIHTALMVGHSKRGGLSLGNASNYGTSHVEESGSGTIYGIPYIDSPCGGHSIHIARWGNSKVTTYKYSLHFNRAYYTDGYTCR